MWLYPLLILLGAWLLSLMHWSYHSVAPNHQCISNLYPEINKEPLQWRHNESNGISHHQPHDCLLNHYTSRKSKKTSKLRITDLCAGNSPVPGEFPAQRASNAENVPIWWCHHVILFSGVTVDAVDRGVNGCVVKTIIPTGAIGNDGRIQVGDYLVTVNNETLRRVTNAQARSILRRASLLGIIDIRSAIEDTSLCQYHVCRCADGDEGLVHWRNSNVMEIGFDLTPQNFMQCLQQNFSYDMEAVLLWKMQIFVVIWWSWLELQMR